MPIYRIATPQAVAGLLIIARRNITVGLIGLIAILTANQATLAAKQKPERRVVNPVAIRVMDYAFPDRPEAGFGLTEGSKGLTKRSLGRTNKSPLRGSAAGFEIGTTWYEYQHNGSMHRQIRTGSSAECPFLIHFEWMKLDQEALVDRHYGYAYYTGDGIASPVLTVQSSGEYAGYVSLEVTSDNRAILSGHNNDDNTIYQPHTYWDSQCGGQTILGSSQIPITCQFCNWEPVWPAIAWQEPPVGDPILHTICATYDGGSGPHSLLYFRKVGVDFSGTYVSGIPGHWVLDTINNIEAYDIFASKQTGKVGICWAAGLPDPDDPCGGGDTCSLNVTSGDSGRDLWDNDLYVQTSDDYGVTWNNRINATTFVPGSDGYRVYTDMSSLITSDDIFHVAYVTMVWDDDNFGTYQSRIFHWSEITNGDGSGDFYDKNRPVAAAMWDPVNCNPGAFNQNQAKLSLSECNGRLYCIWTELNSPNTPGNMNQDDCAYRAFTGDYVGAANGDLFLAVSNDLSGRVWDNGHAVTRSYGGPSGDPDGIGACDAPSGFPCPAEHWPSMTPFGSDYPVVDQGNVVTDLDGNSYDHYLDISYILDPDPGGAIIPYGTWQEASIMWLRIPCIEPVSDPCFFFTNCEIEYPNYNKHCTEKQVPKILENPGNAPLTVTTIVEEDPSPYPGWLDTLNFPTVIPAGDGSIVQAIIRLNANGLICEPGTIVEVFGRLIFDHNAGSSSCSNPCGDTFNIQLIVADTVVGPTFDTVSTTCTDLILSSHGNYGNSGTGGVNMDFEDAGDWKTGADTYLYDGSLVAGWLDGTNPVMHWSMFQSGLSQPMTFKPLGGQYSFVAIDFVGTPWADAFHTGTYLVRDSSLAFETNWYAPFTPTANGETHCAIMIKKTKVYSIDGLQKNNIVLGEAVDWDVPSDSAQDNNSLWGTDLVPPVSNAILQRGVEYPGTNDDIEGWDADERYAALVFLRARAYDAAGNLILDQSAPHNMFTVAIEDYVNPFADGFDEGLLYLNHIGISQLSDSLNHDILSSLTYLANYDMAGDDTLYLYCAFVTQMNAAFPSRTQATISDGISDAVSIFWEHLIIDGPCITGCCCSPGDVNHSGGAVPVDVIDILALVSYLYQGGATPLCMDEADANGDCAGQGPDILDLLAIVDYLFHGAADLPFCHSCGW